MGALVNEVSWSRTRASTFATCKRRYWFQYYLKWNGWDARAPADRKTAYRLSNMTNLVFLAGEAAHEAIKAALTDVRSGAGIDVERAENAARAYMNDTWAKAKAKRFLYASPKWNRPVFELYYGEPPTRERLELASEAARGPVRRLLSSPFFQDLAATASPDSWFWIDEKGPISDDAQAVRVDGARVWALPDFARKDGDRCVVYDWKSGSPKPEDELQILSYSLHARDVWGYPAEKIDALLVYLKEGVDVRRVAVSDATLAKAEAAIAADVAAMRALHATDPPPDAFPTIDDPRACGECFFRELCPVVREVPVHARGASHDG
jgi:CRISPR/Cas system-associated exonuclease Cas4 (RecB family)